MVVRVKDVMEIVETRAPRELACDWDNVGLQVGNPHRSVEYILVALDLSMEVLTEAIERQAQMIVVHHPVLFRPLRALNTGEPLVKLLSAVMQAGVAVYAAHTNLDAAPAGVSQVLARRLELTDIRPLPGTNLGRVGTLKRSMTLKELGSYTRDALQSHALRVYGQQDGLLDRVAVCGGSGGDLVEAAVRTGAQVLITGDIGYHDLLEARERGLQLIDAGHAETERPVVDDLAQYIQQSAAEKDLKLQCLVSCIPAPRWDNHDYQG